MFSFVTWFTSLTYVCPYGTAVTVAVRTKIWTIIQTIYFNFTKIIKSKLWIIIWIASSLLSLIVENYISSMDRAGYIKKIRNSAFVEFRVFKTENSFRFFSCVWDVNRESKKLFCKIIWWSCKVNKIVTLTIIVFGMLIFGDVFGHLYACTLVRLCLDS